MTVVAVGDVYVSVKWFDDMKHVYADRLPLDALTQLPDADDTAEAFH